MVNTSLPGEALSGKMQLPLFSSFAVVMSKQKADNNSPRPSIEKGKNVKGRVSDKKVIFNRGVVSVQSDLPLAGHQEPEGNEL